MARSRRITLFAGHYGSGKTNLAVAFAERLAADCPSSAKVVLADLDIVNPYFRAKDSVAALEQAGVRVVVSEYANSNVDFPAMPSETYALVADQSLRVVIDVGGDDRGALALGRYVDDIRAEANFDHLAVINRSRPLTRTPEAAVEVLREIEAAAKLPFTGIVNNTNLGAETTAEAVLDSLPYAERVAEIMGLPLVATAVRADIAPALAGRIPNLFAFELSGFRL